ncbi:hypothetical protein QQP08_018267 [Theobroma cacao]|nr:hypothetical protein QQP08_018267 [Theobroma cacao]
MKRTHVFFPCSNDEEGDCEEFLTPWPPSSSSPPSGQQNLHQLPPCLPSTPHCYDFFPCKPDPRRRLSSRCFYGEEEHEELLNLSLSLGPPQPLSSSSVPCTHRKLSLMNKPNPKKRLLSQSFDGEENHEEGLDLSLSIGRGPASSSGLPSTHKKRLFSWSFDGEEDHEELLDLSLSLGRGPSSSSGSPSTYQKRLFSLSFDGEEDHEELLNLSISLGPGPSSIPESSSSFGLPSTHHELPFTDINPNPVHEEVSTGAQHCRPRPRCRKNPFQNPKAGKTETIAAPYPWATTRRATVHDLNYLLSHGISMISGDVECKSCQETYKIQYNLRGRFKEIKDFISAKKFAMHDRAPPAWMDPTLDSCKNCGSALKPVIPKKREINWLFLLLGNMLGCCKLSELKYFCKHTKNHRTGAKDRVLYLTYLGLCKQLDPHGPFDV